MNDKQSLDVIGLMSGTSLDGLDGAWCRVDRHKILLRQQWFARFPTLLRDRLLAVASGRASSWELAQVHHDLGRFYAKTVSRWLEGKSMDAIGLHGQTVFHRSHPRTPATLQIGEPAYLRESLKIPVISNFRADDLAAGGQGAPLATLFHEFVFAERGHYVAFQNLGGVGNVTAMDWMNSGKAPKLLSFDTGPANLLMDLVVREYSRGRISFDREGRWARKGRINRQKLNLMLRASFLRRRPPKSTGREEFGRPFIDQRWPSWDSFTDQSRRAEVVATLLEFTARSIGDSYRRYLRSATGDYPERVIVAGGGAKNGFLMQRIGEVLREFIPSIVVETSAAKGWPVSAIEPAAFALLAYRRWLGLPGNKPGTTGARRAVQLGQI